MHRTEIQMFDTYPIVGISRFVDEEGFDLLNLRMQTGEPIVFEPEVWYDALDALDGYTNPKHNWLLNRLDTYLNN